MLIRINNAWPKLRVRQQGYLFPYISKSFGIIKVTYTAGYTANTLPAVLRMALNLLSAKLYRLWPEGVAVTSESYEERSISVMDSEKDYLLKTIRPMIYSFKNYRW